MLVPSIFVPYLEVISSLIGLFGVALVIWAVVLTIYRVVRIEVLHEKRFHQYEHTKRVLIQKVILALDFFVSADLIMLALVQSMEEIVSIAFIVAIRTVLSWSLSREVHLHKE
jgi:uncharacterized membrane protein